MERLSGLDASFIYNETSSLHMHTLKYTVQRVAAIGCREHWTDLHVVTDGMVAALDELVMVSRTQAGA